MRCSPFENPAVKIIIPEKLYVDMYEKQGVPDLLLGRFFYHIVVFYAFFKGGNLPLHSHHIT